MLQTTLCYIEKEDCYLMMHRIKKQKDVNEGKWIGIGGKFEDGETPEECLLRETKEETGLTLLSYKYRGILTFQSKGWESEHIHLFTADEFEGELPLAEEDGTIPCTEGILKWIPKSQLEELNLWAGDVIFLRMLQESERFFSMKLRYEGDDLVESSVRIYDGTVPERKESSADVLPEQL